MDDQNSPQTSREQKQILNSSREIILEWVKIQLKDYVDLLEETLFKLADNADNNNEQSRYFQARDEIKLYQQAMQQLFLKHIYQAFDHYRSKLPTTRDYNQNPSQQQITASTPLEGLSLVGKNALEEQLAIGSMSRKVSIKHSELLYALNQRLSVLRGGAKINEQSNPVSPSVFGEALQHAIANLSLDSRAKLIIYKVFESAFMSKLVTLYERLNQHCESHGILPNLSYQIQKTPSKTIDEQLPEELQDLYNKDSLSNQRALIDAIRLLQSHLQPHTPTAATTTTDATAKPAEQIISDLQQLQHQAGALLSSLDSPQTVSHSDIHHLRQQAIQQTQQAGDVDACTIEIVGLLFEYILNDQQLLNSVKALLSYLHTPVLKIALIDKEFFSLPKHPARQLLNSLVAASERWIEPGGQHKNDVFQQIKKTVERLLKEFDNDVRLFSELTFEFNQYLREHARRISLTEKRAMQATKGENKLKEIRLKIERYINKKIGNIYLPAAIRTLLFEPWANFMAFNLLRFGSRSEQWCQATQAVDDILWYCQPHSVETDSHARKRIKELQQTLLATLQSGFDTIGYDDTQAKYLLSALQDRQQAGSPATTAKPIKPLKANIDDVDISQAAKAEAQNDALLMRLKELKYGSWFEFNADTDKPQRVKLVWSNTNTLHFMFVNRMGQQVAVKTGEQLTAELRSGKSLLISKLEQRPFFEKAMERVLEQLKQRDQASSN